MRFPQPGGLELASLTYQALYGEEGHTEADGIPAVRDKYLAWAIEGRRLLEQAGVANNVGEAISSEAYEPNGRNQKSCQPQIQPLKVDPV